MRPELLVFYGNDCVDHVFRDIVVFYDSSVAIGKIEIFDLIAVRIIHYRSL